MEFREDIIVNGKEILGRELTEKEINEIESAMNSRYDMYCEDYDEDVDIDVLFDEDFYDSLKEIIDEVMVEKMCKELKRKVFDFGVNAIEDLLGYELEFDTDEDMSEAIDDVLDQMPEEEIMEFYNKYCK